MSTTKKARTRKYSGFFLLIWDQFKLSTSQQIVKIVTIINFNIFYNSDKNWIKGL